MIVVAANLHGNFVALKSMLESVEDIKEDLKKEGREIKEIFILGVFGYMPFPRETYEFLSQSDIRCVRGKFDHLIAKWPDMDEEEKRELPKLDRLVVEWNRSKLESEGRRWIRFEIPSFLLRKYGDNEVFFVFGDPFDPIGGEVLPNMPTSYYEKFLAPFKYEIMVVGSRKPFIAETVHGKIVGVGVCGLKESPTFALIDTRNLDVSFYDFDFDAGEVERRIEEENLPKELVDILHHGI